MQFNHPLLDDLAKMAQGAAESLADMKREVEASMTAKFNNYLENNNFVTKEAFEAVQAMAVKAREENEELKKRLDALEARLK